MAGDYVVLAELHRRHQAWRISRGEKEWSSRALGDALEESGCEYKRDRISVYPSAALFEFATPEDLTEALARGLPAVRLTDRLAVVPNEERID